MTQKTPLELTEDIIADNNFLLELNGIFRALMKTIDIKEDRKAREEIIRSLAYRVNTLSIYSANIYWNALELKKTLTKALEAEMQIKDGDELTENDLDFLDEEEGK